jgi:hypothetical protein
MKITDINDIPEETLMDFLDGKFALPEERDMGEGVDFLIAEINKLCSDSEAIRNLDKEGRAHLFECVGAYFFSLFHEYKDIDITEPHDDLEKTMQAFYLKACEWNEEMKAMKRIHGELSKG